jgi:hypoxanthine phosphoribosyltransferase
MPEHVVTMLSSEAIAERVRELGSQITRDFDGASLVLVCVLKGSFVFTSDLMRAIALPLRIDFLGVRSYGEGTESSGVVQITQDLSRPIEGEDILIVEDIVDTGLTIDDRFVVGYGLDFAEKYRNLPYIGVVERS